MQEKLDILKVSAKSDNDNTENKQGLSLSLFNNCLTTRANLSQRYDIKIIKYGNYLDYITRGNLECFPTVSSNISNKKIKVLKTILANEKECISYVSVTFKDNITNPSEANKIFNAWKIKIKKTFKDFKYVKVLEFQGNGKVHFHFITNLVVGKQFLPKSKDIGSDKKYDVLYWKYGSEFDVQAIYDLEPLVSYISKDFITNKDKLNNTKNEYKGVRQYSMSNNLIKPEIRYYNSVKDAEEIDSILNKYEKLNDKDYYNYYQKVRMYIQVYKLKNGTIKGVKNE